VKHARRNIPTGSDIEAVCRSQRRDRVVSAFCCIQQGLANLVLGYAGAEPKKGIGKFTAVVVRLGREIIGLGLAQLTGQCGVFVTVMDVMRQSGLIIEELGIHRPALMLVPESVADNLAFEFGHGSLTFSTLPPSSKTTKLKPSSLEVSGPLSAGVVEENQRSSMPPRSPPIA